MSNVDRREAIRRVAVLLGGTLSAPAIAGVLAGCASDRDAGDSGKTHALSGNQREVVATIADHIIPPTDTPGARDAGVPGFIDTMMAEFYPAADRQRFVAGLADLDARARRADGRDFLRCDQNGQVALLTALDAEAIASSPNVREPHWFRTMKELTLLGYYTSEAGLTKELGYVQVPGRYEGCVSLAGARETRSI